MEYTVTDREGYEGITLTGWGETTSFEAAHAIKDDRVTAYFLEPVNRNERAIWDEDAEERFREEILMFVSSWEEVPDWVVFDPARDRQTEVAREDFGY